MKLLFLVIFLHTCISIDSSNSEMNYKINNAIEYVLKDSIFLEYEKDCSKKVIKNFKIKQQHSFSFFFTYLGEKNRFESLLKEYLESNVNPIINQRNFRAIDSLRYLREVAPKVDLKLLNY